MAQKIRVQDGIIVYTGVDDNQPIDMGVRGTITATHNVKVGNDHNADSFIRTLGPGDLTISAVMGGNLNLSSEQGYITLNNVSWPQGTNPPIGSYLTVFATNKLQYSQFIIGVESSNTLTSAALNNTYITALPGQAVLGPSVIYVCTGLTGNRWRVITAPVA